MKNDSSALPTVEIPFQRRFLQPVRPPENWGEWLEIAVRGDQTFHEKIGHLHGIFNVEMGRRNVYDINKHEYPPYRESERLMLLFEVADGWADSKNFDWRTSEERFTHAGYPNEERKYFIGYEKSDTCYRTESQQRQALARKAFDLLCANFFRVRGLERPRDREMADEALAYKIVSGPLLPVLQRFFRIEEDRIRNLSRHDDHRTDGEKHAVNFLLKLPKILWEWKDPSIRRSESAEERARQEKEIAEMRTRVIEAMPWMIGILAGLGRLDLLLGRVLGLDKSCLDKLKELAMSNELDRYSHPVTKTRTVATIDEACYLGSPAAWLIKRHELMTAQRRRLNEIVRAENEREEATRKVEKLTAET